MQCGEEIADRLDRRDVFGGPAEFTEAWRRASWKGAQAHLALLIQDEHIQWLGRAQGGSAITSRDRIVGVIDVEEIDPIPVAAVGESLPRRHRHLMQSTGILPPAGGVAVVSALGNLVGGAARLAR